MIFHRSGAAYGGLCLPMSVNWIKIPKIHAHRSIQSRRHPPTHTHAHRSTQCRRHPHTHAITWDQPYYTVRLCLQEDKSKESKATTKKLLLTPMESQQQLTLCLWLLLAHCSLIQHLLRCVCWSQVHKPRHRAGTLVWSVSSRARIWTWHLFKRYSLFLKLFTYVEHICRMKYDHT